MKKQTAPQRVLQWQTAVICTTLLAILVFSLYQLPEIADFFKSYSAQMKAAIPQPR